MHQLEVKKCIYIHFFMHLVAFDNEYFFFRGDLTKIKYEKKKTIKPFMECFLEFYKKNSHANI